mgnify:CR=1 FL=1
MKPFLILETGVPIEPLRRHGSFGHWIRVAAGLQGRQVHQVRVLDRDGRPAGRVELPPLTAVLQARPGPGED